MLAAPAPVMSTDGNVRTRRSRGRPGLSRTSLQGSNQVAQCAARGQLSPSGAAAVTAGAAPADDRWRQQTPPASSGARTTTARSACPRWMKSQSLAVCWRSERSLSEPWVLAVASASQRARRTLCCGGAPPAMACHGRRRATGRRRAVRYAAPPRRHLLSRMLVRCTCGLRARCRGSGCRCSWTSRSSRAARRTLWRSRATATCSRGAAVRMASWAGRHRRRRRRRRTGSRHCKGRASSTSRAAPRTPRS